METIIIKNLTEDEFYKEFKPQRNHLYDNASFDGCMFETYGIELDYVFGMSKSNRVVTILEGYFEEEENFVNTDGVEVGEIIPNLYYASGFHYVNRIGFFVLENPFEYEFEVKVD